MTSDPGIGLHNENPVGDICPIGVFDSGIGGLSVLKELTQLLPDEKFIYVADSANAPYGDRSSNYVRERSETIAEFLIDQGVKLIVIACNTATAEAADYLREHVDIPIIGLEPAIKPAANLTQSGVIGVLATERTINSERLLGLTERYANDKKVIAQACPGLVEQVEAGECNNNKTRQLLESYLHPLMEQGVDALILGCTHYPFLINNIRNIVGKEIDILETGKPVARQVRRILRQENLEAPDNASKPVLTFYNSSIEKKDHISMQQLWQHPIKILPL